MGTQNFSVTRKGKTVTFKSDGYVASFDITYLNYSETYEYIKWEAITAGISLSQETLQELLKEVRLLHGE